MNLEKRGLHKLHRIYRPIAMGTYSVDILDNKKPNINTPTSEPSKNLGSSDHCTLFREKTIREALLANCVMPWMGMIKLALINKGNIAISNIPPPKPISPAMTEVKNEINPREYSICKWIP